ncbi:hypothetical protein J3E68DRAFT_419236 [Trichoderma sp. SZMC 28012]
MFESDNNSDEGDDGRESTSSNDWLSSAHSIITPQIRAISLALIFFGSKYIADRLKSKVSNSVPLSLSTDETKHRETEEYCVLTLYSALFHLELYTPCSDFPAIDA